MHDGARPEQTGWAEGLRPIDVAMYAFYLVLLVAAVVAAAGDVVRFVPLALSVVCAFPWCVARHQLGVSFSVRPEARQLVMTGLYSRLRHPVYVFGTLAFLLVVLALRGWSALALWVVLVPLQVLRARREERLLSTTFGAEYDAYLRSTRL